MACKSVSVSSLLADEVDGFGPTLLVYSPIQPNQTLADRLLPVVSAWLLLSDYDIALHGQMGHALLANSKRPDLMAAALDALAVLKSTPEGRQALANFLGQPVFEDAKSE